MMDPASLPSSTVDANNPWLGLASFTEESRSFFHGRDDDAAELARRVQRKLLTVLFGQSGHGKTSLLRAGLVPRLRLDGYCPVYVRLDYAAGSPTPAQQIKAAIFRATTAAGSWTQSGSSVEGESLWEFLHHRDDVLKDSDGRALIPLLIFDQFEEIFTLAQADDAGRQRAQTFLADLADLVENRPPAELEARIDRDETDAAKFDFARADYRILITLREDYLAHLEGLKCDMPSVTQNRVRLARFTGAQALAAVRGPAPQLVSEEVAAQVVRFVSGGTDLARAEVEPSLLSLVCRELNNARLARGQATITTDLLAGSRDTILQEFYERALAEQPEGVRSFIEDVLLTDSGYRESVAEERVKKAFAAAGASAEALAVLVGRRLLRVEDRLDVRRVELTHDVLAGVVMASRSVRREREAKEIAEAQLRATQEKEAVTQRALWRARRIAAICAVLALGAIGSAVFGYFSLRRAQAAEASAVHSAGAAHEAAEQRKATEELAQDARSEAEKIVSYLLDDFYDELEPIGRLDIVGELARRAVEYYRALPVTLRSPLTVRNQALAMTRYGAVLGIQGKLDESSALLDEAVRTFQRLQSNGDQSQELSLGLAVALRSKSRLLFSQSQREAAVVAGQQAVDELRSLALAPNAPDRVRMEYSEGLNRLGFSLLRVADYEKSLATFAECRDVLAGLGARDVSNPRAATAYADGASWVIEAASTLGRDREVESVGQEALAIAAKVLERNPGDRRALRARALTEGYLSDYYADNVQVDKALDLARTSERDYGQLLQLDPTNTVSQNNLGVQKLRVGYMLLSKGQMREGLAKLTKLSLDANIETMPVSNAEGLLSNTTGTVLVASQMGETKSASAIQEVARTALKKIARELGRENPQVQLLGEIVSFNDTSIEFFAGNYEKSSALARASIKRMAETATANADEKRMVDEQTRFVLTQLADAELRLNRLPAAEEAARACVNSWKVSKSQSVVARTRAAASQSVLALILARQGRTAEALETNAPALAFEREMSAKGYDAFQAIDLAYAVFVTGISQPPTASAERHARLEEAARILAQLPAEVRNAKMVVELNQWIADARAR